MNYIYTLKEIAPIDLKDTVNMMLSDDYKERFKAEYYQTRIRYERLEKMLENWGNLSFTPKTPKQLLVHQANRMYDYLYDLEARAEIEGIEL